MTQIPRQKLLLGIVVLNLVLMTIVLTAGIYYLYLFQKSENHFYVHQHQPLLKNYFVLQQLNDIEIGMYGFAAGLLSASSRYEKFNDAFPSIFATLESLKSDEEPNAEDPEVIKTRDEVRAGFQKFKELSPKIKEIYVNEDPGAMKHFLSNEWLEVVSYFGVNMEKFQQWRSVDIHDHFLKNTKNTQILISLTTVIFICILMLQLVLGYQLIKLFKRYDQQVKNSLQASRMSALGFFAGGVAHELNNPLAIIHGRSYQIKKFAKGHSNESEILKATDRIDETIKRMTNIMKGLRVLARDSSEDGFEIMDVEAVLKDAIMLFREKMVIEGIELKYFNSCGDAKIKCRISMISQVLLNLVNNSLEALKQSSQPKIVITCSRQDSTLSISVLDNGPGIPESIRDKIFEPFFTTKPQGEGTGLGLALSINIIEEHNGKLKLVSGQPGQTEFLIELPLHNS